MRVNTCGGIAMPDFTEIQCNAKQLRKRIGVVSEKGRGCITFFSRAGSSDNSVVADVGLIELLAGSLDEENDKYLIRYLHSKKKGGFLSWDEFKEFKFQALVGCYLLKWRQYITSVINTTIQSVIALFQQDLDVTSLADLEESYIDSCLTTLSQYSSFIYEHRKESVYLDLNGRLGDSIQVDIHSARHSPGTTSAAVYGLSTMMNALGI